MRAGFRMLLEEIPGIEIVGEAGDGREALELILKRRPHVAIVGLGLSLSKLNGFEVIARIRKESPQVKAILASLACRKAIRRASPARRCFRLPRQRYGAPRTKADDRRGNSRRNLSQPRYFTARGEQLSRGAAGRLFAAGRLSVCYNGVHVVAEAIV